MTIEQRLIDALHELDDYRPSPDLFARVERSLAEDQAFRRRRLVSIISVVAGLALVSGWVGLSSQVGPTGRLVIQGWRLAVVFIAVAAAIVVVLAPNVRRFARSFVDEVFHLSPETGGRFLVVLDFAYYLIFAGLILVDADLWGLGRRLVLSAALEDLAFRLGFLLVVMGALHVVNIAFLPVLGLIYNSIVRSQLRRVAGEDAPPEAMQARVADRNARSLAIGLTVLAAALAVSLLAGAPVGALLELLS